MKKSCDKKEKIKKITLYRQVKGLHISSIVDEGIRAILNLFIYLFFNRKISDAQKAQNAYKQIKTKETETSKRRKVAYSTFCVFLLFLLFILFLLIKIM